MAAVRIRLTVHEGRPARCVRCGDMSMRLVAFMTSAGVLAAVFVFCDNCDDLGGPRRS